MTPSPSDPDLWGPDVDVDPRDVVDDPEPDLDEAWRCVECDEPCDAECPLCDDCERLHDATRGDLEETEDAQE